MDNIAEYLASYSTSIKYEDLPPEVVHKIKAHLIDALGCGIGGYASDTGKIARRVAERFYQRDMPATIMGSGQKSSLDLATFANGVMITELDFNDFYLGKDQGHPSDNLASIITCADAIHAGGKEVIIATVLAYEIFCRLCDQFNLASRGFDQVTRVISCVAGASKVLGLSQEQILEAINIAVASNISLRQSRISGMVSWNRAAAANAARNAIFAALLAQEGMTGPTPIFEGLAGFFAAVSGPFQLEKFGGEGTPFRIMDVWLKRYPCGRYGLTAIDAAIKIRSKISSVNEIAEINVGISTLARPTYAATQEKWHPSTHESAIHSIPYMVGAALVHGPLGVRHYDDEYRTNSDLLDLIQKIKVEETEECNNLQPDANATSVEVITKSGKKFSELVQYHRGHPRNPFTDEEVEQKFHSLAANLLAPRQRKELLSLIWNLEEVDDFSKIMELLKI